MERNVGSIDKTIRLLFGVILVVIGIIYIEHWLGIVAIVIGAVLFATGLMNRCALYIPFKISTAKKEEKTEQPS